MFKQIRTMTISDLTKNQKSDPSQSNITKTSVWNDSTGIRWFYAKKVEVGGDRFKGFG